MAQNDSGNFAILDIIKSLQFIKANIANFGGDPGNVTLMGESAGAVNVYAVMTSPLVVAARPALVHPRAADERRDLVRDPAAGRQRRHAGAPGTASEPGELAARRAGDRGRPRHGPCVGHGVSATRTPAQIAAYVRGKSADTILTTMVTKVRHGSGPIPTAPSCRPIRSRRSRPAIT
jgi:para-nitrobenzyl esterase